MQRICFLWLILCSFFSQQRLIACETGAHHSIMSHYNNAVKVFEGKLLLIKKQRRNKIDKEYLLKFEVEKSYKKSKIKESINVKYNYTIDELKKGKNYLIYLNEDPVTGDFYCEKVLSLSDSSILKKQSFLFQMEESYSGDMIEYSVYGFKWAEGRLEDGLPVGEWKYYSQSGELQIKGFYDNGEEEGRWEHYYYTSNESYKILRSIADGLYFEQFSDYKVLNYDSSSTAEYKYILVYEVGKDTIIERFGFNKITQSKVVDYHKGQRHGLEIKYDKKGKVTSEYTFAEGLLDGDYWEWQRIRGEENTLLKITGSYKEDKKYEEVLSYYENNQLIRTKIIIQAGKYL